MEENDKVATTMHEIARMFGYLGKYKDALKQFQKVFGNFSQTTFFSNLNSRDHLRLQYKQTRAP